MLKLVLFLAVLVFSTGATLAQTAPGPAPTASAAFAPPTGRSDTIYAVQHLFERRQRGGRNWLYFSVSGLLGVVRVLVSPTTTTVNGYQTKSEIDGGAAAVFGVGFLGLPVAIGVGKLVRFSDKRETEIINAYAATHQLPHAISRRLRRKDFRGGI